MASATQQFLGLTAAGRGFAQVATSEATTSLFAVDLATVGPSVTVTVPTNGLVNVFVQADLQNTAGGAFLGLQEDGGVLGVLMSTTAVAFETRYLTPGSAAGMTSRWLGGPVTMAPAAGSHTYKLVYGTGSAGNAATFRNRKLWVVSYGY